MQVRFVDEKNFDVLNILDFGMISNNEKAIDIYKNIIHSFCNKFRHWEYNCKNNLVRLKQSVSIVPKGVYMIQTYFLLSGLDPDTWVLDTTYVMIQVVCPRPRG